MIGDLNALLKIIFQWMINVCFIFLMVSFFSDWFTNEFTCELNLCSETTAFKVKLLRILLSSKLFFAIRKHGMTFIQSISTSVSCHFVNWIFRICKQSIWKGSDIMFMSSTYFWHINLIFWQQIDISNIFHNFEPAIRIFTYREWHTNDHISYIFDDIII